MPLLRVLIYNGRDRNAWEGAAVSTVPRKHFPRVGETWRYAGGWSTDGDYAIDRVDGLAVYGHRVAPWRDPEDCDLTICEAHDQDNWSRVSAAPLNQKRK